MDNDEAHVAGDFFLQSSPTPTRQRKTFYEHVQRIIPLETIVYIQYCLLRIPFILMYDYLFTEHFLSSIDSFVKYSTEIIDRRNPVLFKAISYILQSYLFQMLLQVNIALVVPLLGLLVLAFLLLCTDRHLVMFYSYTISMLVIYFDYQMTSIPESPTTSSIHLYILQFLLSSIYIQMLNIRPRAPLYKVQTRLCHFAPFALLITHYLISSRYSSTLLKAYYFFWAIVHLAEFLRFHLQTVVQLVRQCFLEELYPLYQNLGLHTLLNYLQARVYFVTLLKIFWLAKIFVLPLGVRSVRTHPYLTNRTLHLNVTGNAAFDNSTSSFQENVNLVAKTVGVEDETLVKTIYFTCLFYGTETIFTLVSLACLISYLVKSIAHRIFRWLHLWTDDVEQIGTLVGVMFFLLLFQSNISRMNLDRRHVPLIKAFSLLIVALFHFLHTILEPQLLKVAMQTMTTRMAFDQTDQDDGDQHENDKTSSSSPSFPVLRSFHHRHVYTCISILISVIVYILLLWRLTTVSTWLLAVTAFSLELTVRLLSTLAQYTIYVLDAYNRLPTIDSFDEYIFRVKAITSCFEFLLGVFLLCNGFYIFCYESRGALRACMLAVHAYSNIIKNARRGWLIVRNRNSAWANVNQLPLATREQIEEYNDICPICHQPLSSGVACVTPCAHLFHQKCLQKAFYTTQNCALCSQPIVSERNLHRE